jgi:hypothetical protein
VPCIAHHLSATRDDQLGRQALNHFVSLIARQASHCDDPSIWFGSRGPNVQNFTFNLQHVTGAGWIRPIKLAACPDDTASQRQAAFNQKAHSDRSSVPSARRKAQKTGVIGSLIIKVEGLRIELTGKCFDLLLINNVGSARKALSNLEIIEIEPIAAAEFRHGRPNPSYLVIKGSPFSIVSAQCQDLRGNRRQQIRLRQGLVVAFENLCRSQASA